MQTDYKEIEQAHFILQRGIYFSEIFQKDSYIITFSDTIEDYYWNYAASFSLNNIEKIYSEIESFLLEHKRNPAFYITSYNLYKTNFEEFLIKLRYKKEFVDSWMLFDLDKRDIINNQLTQKVLMIKEVENLENMHIFVKVFKNSYSSGSHEDIYGALPEYYYKALLNSFYNKSNEKKIIHFIGYLNNEPISIATCILYKEFAGIYNVGTIHEHRKKGFGSIISAVAISNAISSNCRKIFLQTEKDSFVEDFYSKLGFTKLFTGNCFVKS